ncbi:hypothetical protein [Mucilaginibacter sp. L196]|uniref:hypothetical protein n=1 Tax=Mucilaginibacter sp. L196 TaxID=1641870 RepID=UPI00131EBCA4|nr:hypothetical protein [Mucilaginibacter sp. L196]
MTTIYTVCTGQGYKYGAFALINSIRAMGCANPIVVGTDVHLQELDAVDGVSQFIFDTDWNGTNLKAYTILKQPSDRFIYFDADIILTSKTFIPEIEKLLDEDKLIVPIDGIVSENEIRRSYWKEIYPGNTDKIEHSWYYNAGFFAGTLKQHKQLLMDWMELNQKYLNLKAFLFENERLPMADQDTLNAILQTLPINAMVTIQIPDWRIFTTDYSPFFHIGNFRPHAFLHCTDKDKSWKVKKIPARAPHAYDDLWYYYSRKNTQPVNFNPEISWWVKQWFERTIISRIIIKLKKILN